MYWVHADELDLLYWSSVFLLGYSCFERGMRYACVCAESRLSNDGDFVTFLKKACPKSFFMKCREYLGGHGVSVDIDKGVCDRIDLMTQLRHVLIHQAGFFSKGDGENGLGKDNSLKISLEKNFPEKIKFRDTGWGSFEVLLSAEFVADALSLFRKVVLGYNCFDWQSISFKG